MKLTAIFLIAVGLHVSAKSVSQSITLSGKNLSLQQIFQEIEQQTGYVVTANYSLLEKSKLVTIQAREMTVQEFLDKVLKEQALSYYIENKTIIISRKEKLLATDLKSAANSLNFLPIIGRLTDSSGMPLAGISVLLKGTKNGTTTDASGVFSINAEAGETLVISSVEYETQEVKVTTQAIALAASSDREVNRILFSIKLTKVVTILNEVEIVSTGYENIPKERATGSFTLINNELFNRRVSTDVLSRLEDISPGLIANRDPNALNSKTKLSIRGQSSINATVDPLIILNNFPFEGDINDINPNDVESVTVLKDAAAASIWGAKSGNGVIVITTKKGYFSAAPKISFNSNISVSAKPDLFYLSQMSSADFIDLEKKLFAQGYYQTAELSNLKTALSPVVDLLIAKRDGLIDEHVANTSIESLKSFDMRKDIHRYIQQNAVRQQYAVNLAGGGANQKYYLSAGVDRNKDNLARNGFNRTTLNAISTHSFLERRLELTVGFNFVQSNTLQNNSGYISGSPYYPYTRLADEQGNPLAVTKTFSRKYLSSVAANDLLDWSYVPLNELELADQHTNRTDYRMNATATYKIANSLQANLLYQYDNLASLFENLQSVQAFSTRNLINSYTQTSGGTLTYPVPYGDVLDRTSGSSRGHRLRGQLKFDESWASRHQVTAIAGYEISDLRTTSAAYRLYGYDDEHATSKAVNYMAQFPQYYNAATTLGIPNKDNQTYLTDRFLSYYTNAAYNYKHRYTFSASARLDRSNIFGVKANQKGVPLWSAGVAWNVDKEKFYTLHWLPNLKIRATYGYSGNVYKQLSAYITASYQPSAPNTQLPYANVINPPNPELRWERVKMLNVGVDFNTKGAFLSGSIEYYRKEGLDLIGLINTAPQTGIASFSGNNASITGDGIDLTLQSQNIRGAFEWQTVFILSYVSDRVTHYDVKASAINYVQSLGGLPLKNRPLFALYSYPWAGLDPNTGNPQSYLSGEVSQNYSQIMNTTMADQLIYHGAVRPTIFGALRNSFTCKGITLSANISYRLKYFFRRNSINYAGALTAQGGHGDYALRWLKPGDERYTQVPSLPASIDQNRDNLYLYSTALVEKGDHIRLQDISLSFNLKDLLSKSNWQGMKLYLYANNLGMIWTASKSGIDPDYQYGRLPFSLAAGLKLDF